jgi:ribosome-binding protein aMBF1 (putative translation factor)
VLDTTYHKRRTDERLGSPEFRAEYERTRRELEQVNAVMQQLDDLRVGAGLSKADLAREIGRNDAVVRRLFTSQVNPELRTVAALAAALDAEIQIVLRPRSPRRQRARHTEPAGA